MIPNLNILRWSNSIDKQDHRKWWAFGRIAPVYTGLDNIPPFQLPRPQTGAAIISLKLVVHQTSVETDILANAVANGLEVAIYDPEDYDYDLIIYPGTLPIAVGATKGLYYMIMSDGTNTWYSELFNMCDDLSGMIKIEYYHSEDFVYAGGHIRYTFPYKSTVYIDSDIAKPSYEYEERVSKRQGKNLAIQQISYKLHRFVFLAPEPFIDAFRAIRLHDFVFIEYDGYQFDVDEFLMGDPVWQTEGFLAEVEVEFKTDTVIVVNGRGLTDFVYDTADGTCIPQTGSFYSVKTQIEVNTSDEWTMGHYTNRLGVMVDFEVGDYVILRVGENAFALYLFNAPNDYTLIDLTGFYTKIYIENTGEYLYDRGDGADIRRPRIIGLFAFVVPATYYGETMEIGITDLYLEDVHGNQTFFQRVTNADLQGGVEIDTGDARYIVLKVSTLTCGVIMEDRFEIALDYTIFTGEDDDDSIILTGEDDDDSIIFGDPDLDSITYP